MAIQKNYISRFPNSVTLNCVRPCSHGIATMLRIFTVRLRLLFVLTILFFSSNIIASPLRSPVDVRRQGLLFEASIKNSDCKALPNLPKKVESVNYYTDKRASIIDPILYKKFLSLRKIIVDEEDFLAEMNTKFIVAPSSLKAAIGACLLAHLVKFADDNAFIDSDDIRGGGAVRLMSVTPLMSYLIVRDGLDIPNIENKKILDWILRLVTRLKYLEIKFKYDNNIEDWTAASLALGAVALDQPALLQHALAVVRRKSGAITENGILPQEVARGVMGVDYSLSAIQALAVVIAVAQENGIHILNENDGAPLIRMMKRMVRTINEPLSFLEFTDEPGAIEPSHFDRRLMGWLDIYYRYTGDSDALRIICARHPTHSWRTGGDWFVFFGDPSKCARK